MAQSRLFDYKDDDSTYNLNIRKSFIADAGRYFGFDLLSKTGNTLTLHHTVTGKIVYSSSSNNIVGVWASKQGVMISEDGQIPFAINPNNSNDPRIDILVGSHSYSTVIGGLVGTYSVIQGIPAANPAVPSVLNVATDVILGYVFIDGNTTTIENVKYVPASPPNFASDQTIAHNDRDITYKGIQRFWTFLRNTASTTAEISDNSRQIVLNGYEMGNSKEILFHSKYVAQLAAGETKTGFSRVSFLRTDVTDIPEGTELTVYIDGLVHFRTGSDFINEYYAQNEYVTLWCEYVDSDVMWRVVGHANVKNSESKFYDLLVFNHNDAAVSGSLLTPNTKANTNQLDVPNSTVYDVSFIKSFNSVKDDTNDKTLNAGLWFVLNVTMGNVNSGITLRHNQSGSANDTKPIWLPNQADVTVKRDLPILFIETPTHFRVLGVEGRTDEDIITLVEGSSLFNHTWTDLTITGGGGMSAVSGDSWQYVTQGKTTYFRGQVQLDASVYFQPLGSTIGTTAVGGSLSTDSRPTKGMRIPVLLIDPTLTNTSVQAFLDISSSGAVSLTARGGFSGTYRIYFDGIAVTTA